MLSPGHTLSLMLVVSAAIGSFQPEQVQMAASPAQATATPVPMVPPTGSWPAPSATPPDTTDPTARDILQRSDEAMNALRSMRERYELVDPRAPSERPVASGFSEYVAPNRIHDVIRDQGGTLEVIMIAFETWSRSGDAAWSHEKSDRLTIVWPWFDRLSAGPDSWRSASRNMRVIGEETLPSGPAWVVAYDYAEQSEEGWYTVFVRERIDQATYRLLRQEMTAIDPWGSGAINRHDCFDFNVPITIEPPDLTPATPSFPRIFAPFAGRG